MARTKYRIVPGREDDVFVGSFPDGEGGVQPMYKRLGDFTQSEMETWKKWCPTTALVQVVQQGTTLTSSKRRDNKPDEPLPVKPKAADDEQTEAEQDEA